MEKKPFCVQCGPGGNKPKGILKVFEGIPDPSAPGEFIVSPSWRVVGPMCETHLQINGAAARSKGSKIRIIPLKVE